MALRGLVTGSDNCTPADGAGPSNALGSLANSLLGGASKQQERSREASTTKYAFSWFPAAAAFLDVDNFSCKMVLTLAVMPHFQRINSALVWPSQAYSMVSLRCAPHVMALIQ